MLARQSTPKSWILAITTTTLVTIVTILMGVRPLLPSLSSISCYQSSAVLVSVSPPAAWLSTSKQRKQEKLRCSANNSWTTRTDRCSRYSTPNQDRCSTLNQDRCSTSSQACNRFSMLSQASNRCSSLSCSQLSQRCSPLSNRNPLL